jgi:hypothetical protein
MSVVSEDSAQGLTLTCVLERVDNGQVLRLLNMWLAATYVDPSEAAIFTAASDCSSSYSAQVAVTCTHAQAHMHTCMHVCVHARMFSEPCMRVQDKSLAGGQGHRGTGSSHNSDQAASLRTSGV